MEPDSSNITSLVELALKLTADHINIRDPAMLGQAFAGISDSGQGCGLDHESERSVCNGLKRSVWETQAPSPTWSKLYGLPIARVKHRVTRTSPRPM